MPLRMSHLISRPLVQYTDIYGSKSGDYFAPQVQALYASCNQPWFDYIDITPAQSKVFLQHLATMSPLEELPSAILDADADHTDLDHQRLLAYAPFLSFLTEVSKLVAGSQTADLPALPPNQACFTMTALFQSALLASKLLACTEMDPSIPVDKTYMFHYVVCGLGEAVAKHISNSKWAENGPVNDLPKWLVRSCLKSLRQVIKDHHQGSRSSDFSDAAKASMALLTSLLRPGTQVAAMTMEAMYNSGMSASQGVIVSY